MPSGENINPDSCRADGHSLNHMAANGAGTAVHRSISTREEDASNNRSHASRGVTTSSSAIMSSQPAPKSAAPAGDHASASRASTSTAKTNTSGPASSGGSQAARQAQVLVALINRCATSPEASSRFLELVRRLLHSPDHLEICQAVASLSAEAVERLAVEMQIQAMQHCTQIQRQNTEQYMLIRGCVPYPSSIQS